jgi:hypothetical protein
MSVQEDYLTRCGMVEDTDKPRGFVVDNDVNFMYPVVMGI